MAKDGKHFCPICNIEINTQSKFCVEHMNHNSKNYCCMDCGGLIKRCTALQGKGRCHTCSNRELWNRPGRFIKHRIKLFKALLIYPNKPEIVLINLLKSMKSNFKYVGNAKKFIGKFNPDFINENKKLIIELYGKYWHTLPDVINRDKERIKIYKQAGYKTLIIWDKSLKNINRVKSTIKKFLK